MSKIMVSTAIYITVPLLLEALAKYLNKPYEKLQEYYETSKAFRDYITSLTRDFDADIENKIIKTTPSTTPRFDVPWMLEQLKKKQQEIFNIKKELAANEIRVEQAQRAEFKEPPKIKKSHKINGRWHLTPKETPESKQAREKFKSDHGYLTKNQFLKKKAEDTKQANLKTIELNNKLQQTVDKPLRNTDPRYKTYTERIHNAQRHKKTDEK